MFCSKTWTPVFSLEKHSQWSSISCMFLKASSIFTIENHLQTLGSFSNSRAKCVDGEQGQNKNIWLSEKILQIAPQLVGIFVPFTYYKILERWFIFFPPVCSKESTMHTLSSCCQSIIGPLTQCVGTVPSPLQVLTSFPDQENGYPSLQPLLAAEQSEHCLRCHVYGITFLRSKPGVGIS